MKTRLSTEQTQRIREKYFTSCPRPEDKLSWFKMWEDYAGSDAVPTEEVLEQSWLELLKPHSAVRGIFLYHKKTGILVGFSHYILHPSLWQLHPVCYVEDAYIVPNHRATGAMVVLYEALIQRKKEYGWERLYWITRSDNLPARRFYDRIADITDWIRYEHNGS